MPGITFFPLFYSVENIYFRIGFFFSFFFFFTPIAPSAVLRISNCRFCANTIVNAEHLVILVCGSLKKVYKYYFEKGS